MARGELLVIAILAAITLATCQENESMWKWYTFSMPFSVKCVVCSSLNDTLDVKNQSVGSVNFKNI